MSSSNLRLIDDCLLVCILKSESKSGIIFPDTSDKSQVARVLEVGPGKMDGKGETRVALDIKKGDMILLRKHAGTDVNYQELSDFGLNLSIPADSSRVAVIRYSDVLLVF
ncbi:hypothetical protein [Candidatus Gromoviella agglomerans]|uniref:hypothetical protein n=1 Tax=Candidatus Gromoviella agglomerans TaxID=2806609 RepID=UPI001E606F2D|nr:hypothetical protein [Candidatus Gromoviella agglomerans]UFX98396.1 Cochaperonin GroES [Candidatus Gromoviella agglomerans]